MEFADYVPAFCGDCEIAISVMERHDGEFALACSCPGGRVPLDGDRGELVTAWSEDGPPTDEDGGGE